MLRFGSGVAATTLPQLLVVALMGAAWVGDAEAKGRRSGGSSSSSHASPAKPKQEEGGSNGITVHIRSGGNSSSQGATGTANSFAPLSPAAGGAAGASVGAAPIDAEEAARRAAFMERQAAEKAAAERAAIEKAEAERIAAEKLEAELAVQRAAREKAEAARLAAETEKRRREEAAVHADVDRVLQRAKDDYPVLRTPEGQPLLQRILERQKALMARGMYPSVAMVEAVADHREQLAPRVRTVATEAAAPAPAAPSAAFGGCRWVTPTQWACNK